MWSMARKKKIAEQPATLGLKQTSSGEWVPYFTSGPVTTRDHSWTTALWAQDELMARLNEGRITKIDYKRSLVEIWSNVWDMS